MSAATQPHLCYYKRYRMECDLAHVCLVPEPLPAGYGWREWNDWLLETHAAVKFECFAGEIDGQVFANLGHRAGCERLMREIRHRTGFCPQATWLLTYHDEPVGTVQGICERGSVGSIQNLGVVPSHRGRGLGRALLIKALRGFLSLGLLHGSLEVTAVNHLAVQMYRRFGFRCRKTLYRGVVPTIPLAQPEYAV